MEFVDPIYDVKDIRKLKLALKKKSPRDYLLFVFGINTGLRISELLPLTYADVLTENKCIKTELNKEEPVILINHSMRKALQCQMEMLPSIELDNYLFASPKTGMPISRQQAYRMIHTSANQVGIDARIGTHTMRKTFGYHAYRKGIAISLIQKRLHHASPAETMKYIGLTKKLAPRIDVEL
ncbi:tyrosine-type recombinase/integrase [Paenalkalicoccus suaedae]|uniref:Tyrosine-type recombinase/integrase n=1 Tax=Paenalkalicoccus suaedae TaxID=2592382 RepID=A0A859FCW1_9BACI|nr:tyrosine-type recombinase/integrase [Paenalkalicoccus suaedae]QKS70056.1 tyrosine-type recombinase/integrase [Paenalkalicoccus suaedae]